MLAEYFETVAASNPQRIAVEEPGGRQISYSELDASASGLAQRLHTAGVRQGDRVGIYLPKSIEAVTAVLGVLKARAAYVPLDSRGPVARTQHILRDCGASLLCTNEAGARTPAGQLPATPIVLSDWQSGTDAEGWPDGADGADGADGSWRAPRAASAEDLSYLLYTSGSTGLPKGVAHTHSSATSFVEWAFKAVQPGSHERFSSHAPFHFDLSIFDLFVCFRAGGTLVLVDETLGTQPRQLAAFIAERRINIWYSVPSILAMLAKHGRLDQCDCSALRLVVFAGEVFPVDQLKDLQRYWPEKTYYNFYGPTETNVCTAHRLPGLVPEEQTEAVPIGRACDNVRAKVLGESGAARRPGEPGLLYVHASGPVMHGYWRGGDAPPPEAFHTDEGGERWYCTGDLVSEDADGCYRFLGRSDRMVKRRGYRIELAEIEAALQRHDELESAVAVASESPERGMEIVAFLVAAKRDAKLSPIALKQFCNSELPHYMCPDRFVTISDLPRTSTDKVDLQRLAELAHSPRESTQ